MVDVVFVVFIYLVWTFPAADSRLWSYDMCCNNEGNEIITHTVVMKLNCDRILHFRNETTMTVQVVTEFGLTYDDEIHGAVPNWL